MNLPKLDVFVFDGKNEEWMSFSGLFKAPIDSCTTLSDCQKLQYFKASVKSDAAKLISSVALTSANYSIARKILIDSNQNERNIARSYFRALCSCPAAKTNDAQGLGFLIKTFEKNLMAMNALGADNWKHC